MAKPEMPKSDAELRALSDADLDLVRDLLNARHEQLRVARKVLAIEAERRARLPKAEGKA